VPPSPPLAPLPRPTKARGRESEPLHGGRGPSQPLTLAALQANPWAIEQLKAIGTASAGTGVGSLGGGGGSGGSGGGGSGSGAGADLSGEHPFYPLREFRVALGHPLLPFPSALLVSDNYFRPRWIGVGERRLKNIVFLLEVSIG
jgi:hypothetical protein